MPRKKGTRGQAINLATLQSQYGSMAPLAARFSDELKHQIERILKDNAILLSFPIQSRVKTWSSVSEKLQRGAVRVSVLNELNDLVGLRLILQFRRDVARLCELLQKSFVIIERYDTAERLKEDQFGYSSIHVIVELPESWLAVPTLSTMKGLRAELQVRTTAQHIWAAASHTLQYKREESVPSPVRRAIYRVSALLETVDLEFERVLAEREEYRSTLERVWPGTGELNVDVIERALDVAFPQRNKKSGNEPYAELLTDVLEFKVDTETKFTSILAKHRDIALAKEASAVALHSKNLKQASEWGLDVARLQKGVFFSHVGLARAAFEAEFGGSWSQYMQKNRSVRAGA